MYHAFHIDAITHFKCKQLYLLPTGSEESVVLRFGSIPAAIFPFCQYVKSIAL